MHSSERRHGEKMTSLEFISQNLKYSFIRMIKNLIFLKKLSSFLQVLRAWQRCCNHFKCDLHSIFGRSTSFTAIITIHLNPSKSNSCPAPNQSQKREHSEHENVLKFLSWIFDVFISNHDFMGFYVKNKFIPNYSSK